CNYKKHYSNALYARGGMRFGKQVSDRNRKTDSEVK
ncbi:MAG: hypothetical protein ACI8Q3_002186, partial [Marinomonas primoryensis]